MIWLSNRIEKIQHLVTKDTSESLTYAALEARLAIEEVCYERLRVAHDYISHDDIRKWQPTGVVNTLLQEVDDKAASALTLLISNEPTKVGSEELSKEEFEKQEYVKIGEQAGFDPKKLGRLWNALSSFLHVKLPKTKHDNIKAYGDINKLKRKVEEVLVELDIIAKGTLIMSGFGETVSFQCYCDSTIRRRISLLKDNQIISCINPACSEQWKTVLNGSEIEFERKKVCVVCKSCGNEICFPEREMLALKLNKTAKFDCQVCNDTNFIAWRLVQAK